jgi:hypothetical protein
MLGSIKAFVEMGKSDAVVLFAAIVGGAHKTTHFRLNTIPHTSSILGTY